MNHENMDICPKTQTCPLFLGQILETEKANKIFKRFFCNAGEAGRNECKRFLLSLEGFKADLSILPNDPRSIEDLKKYLSDK